MKNVKTSSLIRGNILGIFVLMFIFPLIWLILTSLKTDAAAFATPPKFIFTPYWGNYARLFARDSFSTYFINSILCAGGATFLSLALGSLAAFGFTRFKFRGSFVVLMSILLLRMFPPITTIMPIFLIFRKFGLCDTRLALILVYTSLNLSLVIWLLYDFFNDIPRELDEAAYLDGCSLWKVFRMVILPLAAPGLIAAGILTFVFSWSEFLFALVLTSLKAVTTPVLVSTFVSDQVIRWGDMSSVGFLTTLPILILGIVVKKYLVQGLTMGSIKG